MKVLVVNPGSFNGVQYIKEGRCESRRGAQMTVPITLGVIAQLLRQNNFEVKIKDLMINPMGYSEMKFLLSDSYDIVLLSTSTPTFESDKNTARLIKKINPKARICVFGTVVSAIPELALEDGVIDFVARREPELIVLELCKLLRITNNNPTSEEISLINGLCFRENNRIRLNPEMPFIHNLDSLPFPARDLMDNERYLEPKSGRPFTVIIASRGCPYSCIFCTVKFYYGNNWRARSAENIVSELEECVKKYNIKDFLFLSDTFTLQKENTRQLCQKIIDKRLDINWACNSRVDTIDLDTARMMKNAGCWLISFGVESGDREVLKIIKKEINPEDAIIAANICRQAGILSYMYYIFGFPGEAKESMVNTVRLALKADSDFARFYTATPLPGSRLYEIAAREEKIRVSDFYSFDLSNCNISLSSLSNSQLKKMVRKAHIKFYLRINYIIRMLKRLNGREIMNLSKTAFYFLRSNVFKT